MGQFEKKGYIGSGWEGFGLKKVGSERVSGLNGLVKNSFFKLVHFSFASSFLHWLRTFKR